MVPKLRFPLFHSQWDAVSLGDIIKIKSGQGFKAEEYSKSQNINKVRLLQIENVGYGTTKWTDNVKYLPDDYLSSYKEFTLEKGDVVLALNRPVTNNQLKITTLKSEDVPSILYQRVGKFIFLEKGICEQFYYQMFQEKIKNFVLVNSIGSDQPFISLTTLYRHEVYSTKLCEQTKIADFLSSVDEKISLLNKQYDLLCQYKKGIMQKIFSQEVRFKDENGDAFPKWKKIIINELGKIVGGGTPDTGSSLYWDGGIPWFTPTEIKERFVSNSNRTITFEGLASSSAKLLPAGTILFTSRATIGDVAIALNECATNQGFQNICVNDNNYNLFVYYLLIFFKSEFIRRAGGSTFPEISKSNFKSVEIEIPSLSEQIKIASFLSAIDEKTSAKKAELDKLKTWKQGLLQQMFV